MAGMEVNFSWRDRKVLVTGHTGFKGGWLTTWLYLAGAKVYGVSLDPPTSPNLFETAGIAGLLSADCRLDIRKGTDLAELVSTLQPEIIFHLAAQPLVNYAYEHPVETYGTNVMGTINLLEAVRATEAVKAVVVVTTDKCYENREWIYPYRETDTLGGHDPYSSSKACAELVTAAWRLSYFSNPTRSARLATVRAGNVIGGGDWAEQRLVPDIVRAYQADEPLSLRYPYAVRPWQHVLDPIAGYVALGERLLSQEGGAEYATAWNFGPDARDARTVGEVARLAAEYLPIHIDMPSTLPANHEAGLLRLDSSFAAFRLGWGPRLNLESAISETMSWYQAWLSNSDMHEFTLNQVRAFKEGASDA